MPPLPTAFRRNALANYANSMVALVLALVVTPLLVRGLGKEAYGTWVLVSTSVDSNNSRSLASCSSP